MIFVLDAEAGGWMLRAGWLACPVCSGRLRVWTPARKRDVATSGGGRITLTPDRGRCTACGITHVVLPAWYVPRRGYSIEVIGQVLLGGARQAAVRAVAERLALPVTTAATWLRQARQAAGSLLRQARLVAGPAAGDGARVLAGSAVSAVSTVAGPGSSGIDYLTLLAARHHAQVLRQLHTNVTRCGIVSTISGQTLSAS